MLYTSVTLVILSNFKTKLGLSKINYSSVGVCLPGT